MKKNRTLCVVTVVLIVFMGACRKPTLIGDEIIPGSDFLYSQRTDTFRIITNTLYDDSVTTSFNLFYSLGSIESDVFGKTSAHIYTQVSLPSNNLNFGTNPAVDSVVITLDYAVIYGDTLAPHTVNVYKMVEDIDATRTYFSNSKLHDLHVPVGSKNFVPNNHDSVVVYGNTFAPHLRIKLSDAFAIELFDQSDTTKFIDNENFRNFLKGIYLETDTTAGFSNGIMQFNMASIISGMQIFYHNDDADSLSTLLNFTGLKYNYFTHNYTETAPTINYLTNPDTINGDEEIFVHGFAGLKSYIQIPFLTNLQDVGINKAEIIFTVLGEIDTIFDPPTAILLTRTDSTLENKFNFISYTAEQFFSLPDQGFDNSLSYGGSLDTLVNRFGQTVNVYKYDISLYFQDIIAGREDNNGMMLTVYAGNRLVNGVVLAGSSYADTTKRPYLSVTYTLVDP
ncbi:MAG: DUF4270 domain-containing protein [Chitinophagales bacterium]|nr:DUF4270 domain-containing protein [Chitinophagales bacterium]